MGRNTTEVRQRNLKLFHRKSKLLLNDIERDYLHDVLKQYESSRDVKKLMVYLLDILDTSAKLDLLVEIRGLIPKMHLAQFDWLAPYAKMAHPVILTAGSAQHGGSSANGSVKHRLRKSRSDGSVIRGTNGFHDNPATSVVRMVTIDKDGDAPGINIQGGSENGRGIFISSVESGSVEESLGLGAGDQILEVNNISFDNITSSSAKMVLQGNSRLRLKVQHCGPVAGHRVAKEKTSWFDTVRRKIVAGEFNDVDPSHAAMGGTRLLSRGDERRVNITPSSRQCIGFNIRGGREYGVGIYVSKVDGGGLAEAHGVNVGDQIIDVNGVTTENATHAQAVELIRNQPCLIMTIRSVNRYPAYKELCNEYEWAHRDTSHKRPHSSSPTSGTNPLTHNELIDAMPVEVAEHYTQTHAHNQSTDWLPNQSVTMSPTPIPKSSRSSVASETTALIQKHLASSEQSKPVEPQKIDERTSRSAQSAPQTAASQPTSSVKDKRIGRSHSMKFPGEKALPVFETESETKQTKSQKNRTFREVLFGMKMKSRDKREKADKQRDKKPAADPRHAQKRYPSSEAYASLNKKPSTAHPPFSGAANQSEAATTSWATRKTIDRDPAATSSNPGSIVRRQRPKPVSVVPPPGHMTQHASSQDTQQQAAFLYGAGTQLMYSEARYASALSVLDDMAKKLLSNDEQNAVMRHVRRYHQEGMIENLVMPVLTILDRPEKILLLRELRGVIAPSDLGRFDSMVSRKELQAYDDLQFGRKDMSQPLNPMRRNSIGKPKKTILETKADQEGKFFLRTQEDIEMDRRRQNELEELRRENQKRITGSSPEDGNGEGEEDDPTADENSLHNSDIAMSLFDNPSKDHFQEQGPNQSGKLLNISTSSSTEEPSDDNIVVAVRESTVKKHPVNLERHQQMSSPESASGGKEAGSGKSIPLGQEPIPQILVSQNETDAAHDEPDHGTSGVHRGFDAQTYGLGDSDDDDDDDDVELPRFEDDDSESDSGSDGEDEPLKPSQSGLYSLVQRNNDSGQGTSQSINSSPAWSSPNGFSPISEMSLPVTPASSVGSPTSPVIPKTPPNTERSPIVTSPPGTSPTSNDEPIYAKVDLSKKTSRQSVKNNLSVEGSIDGSMDSNDSGRRSSFKVTFTEYRGSPSPSRKGILKNSFRNDEKPQVEKRRMNSDYMDIDDINLGEPAPLQEIDAEAKTLKASSVSSTAQDQMVEQVLAGMETLMVTLKKNRASLGISVSGGRDSKHQPEVRIDRIFQGGAASDDGILQAGCEVISVDGQSLQGVTHPQAVDIIRKAYHDKNRKIIEFMVKQPAEMNTHL